MGHRSRSGTGRSRCSSRWSLCPCPPSRRRPSRLRTEGPGRRRLLSRASPSTPKPWTAMREKEGDGGLALLYEGGWVYGGWAGKDKATTEKNVGYVLYPTENGGPSFTVGGPGTVWMVTSQAKNKDLAWEFIKTWNNKDTVAKINIEDPHPVARTDSAEVPEFKADKFLVDSTESLKKAKFTPVDAAWGKVILAIQNATERVATGEGTVDDAASRFQDELKRAVGDANVVTG